MIIIHSQIQYWRDKEVKKIQSEYERKRKDISSEAFEAGLSGCSKSDQVMQDINSRYSASYQQETAAVKEIYDKADKCEKDRLDKLEAERKESVRRAWSVLHK